MSNKVAIITGASSGIGKATAYEFADEGIDVALVSRRGSVLTEIAEDIIREYDSEAIAVSTDISVSQQVGEMVDRVIEEYGKIDILVNNAAIGSRNDRIDNLSIEDFQELTKVNVNGTFYTTRMVLPHMLDLEEGNIVFIGSFAGKYPRPGKTIYSASKWWTTGFAYSLAGTLGSEGIGVSLVNPAETWTNIKDGIIKEKFDQSEVTLPNEIAQAVLFACQQRFPSVVAELNLYRRDKLANF